MPSPRLAALVSLLCMLLSTVANGQEVTQKYYNVQAGPVYFTLSARNTVEFNDNVNLSSGRLSPIQSDIIVTPNIGVTAFSELEFLPVEKTSQSTLSLHMNLGYQRYLEHPELSSRVLDINIAPDSELSFLIRTGNFKINIHDGFSLQSDPVTEGALSNIAQFRRFLNTAGIDTQWDVNSKTTLDLAYSHSNLIAMDILSLGNSGTTNLLNTSRYDSATDRVALSAASKVLSLLTLGAGATASATTFPSDSGQDSTTYTFGPFAEFRLTEYTTIKGSCGVTENRGGNFFTGSGSVHASSADTTTEYFNLSVFNLLNSYYTQNFSIGRETVLNIFGTLNETNYVRYSSAWKVNSKITLSTGIFAEDTQDVGFVGLASHYRRYGLDLSAGYQLSRKMTTSLAYRFADKVSDDPFQSYKQNSIVWTLDYRF